MVGIANSGKTTLLKRFAKKLKSSPDFKLDRLVYPKLWHEAVDVTFTVDFLAYFIHKKTGKKICIHPRGDDEKYIRDAFEVSSNEECDVLILAVRSTVKGENNDHILGHLFHELKQRGVPNTALALIETSVRYKSCFGPNFKPVFDTIVQNRISILEEALEKVLKKLTSGALTPSQTCACLRHLSPFEGHQWHQ